MADTTGALTNYAEEQMLIHIFHAVTTLTAITPYIGLHTANPTDAATGAEVTVAEYENYTRSAITFGVPAARLTSGGAVSGFPQAGGGSTGATVTHYGVWDASGASGGNLIAYGELVTSKTIASGNTPSIASGEVELSFQTAGISNYLAHAILSHLFRATTYTKPSTFVFMTTAELTDASTGSTLTEPANGYAREEVTAWTIVSDTADNDSVITVGPPTGAWGVITAVGVADTLTTGEVLFYNNTPGGDGQSPTDGDTVQFAAGTFDNILA